MPKVPEEQTPTFATNIPSVAFPFRQEFGKVGQAFERGGEQLENAGVVTSNIIERVQATRDLAAGSNADIQDKLDADQAQQKIKQQAIGGMMYDRTKLDDKGNPTPIYNDDGVTQKSSADAMQDWFKTRFNDTQNGLDSDNAKAIYRNKFQDYAAQQLVLMRHDSMAEQVKYGDSVYDKNVGDIQTAQVQNPDLNNLYGRSQDLTLQRQQSVTQGHHTEAEIEDIGRKTNEALASSTVKGAWAQEIANNRNNPGAMTASLNKWISILKGQDQQSLDRQKDGLPTISSMMSPNELATELKQMQDHIPEARRADLANWDHYTKNLVAGMSTGRIDPNETLPRIIRDLHNQVVNGDREAGAAGQIYSDAAAAAAIGMVTKNVRIQTPEQMQDTATNAANFIAKSSHEFAKTIGFPAEAAGEPERKEVLAKTATHIQTELEKRNSDFAGHLSQIDQDSRLPAISAPMATFSQLDANKPIQLGAKGNPMIAQAAFRDADLKAQMMHLPPDKLTYLPKENSGSPMNSGTLAHTLKDEAVNGQTAWNNLAGIKKMAGTYAPKIIDQMIADDKLPAEWGLMRNVDMNIDPRTGQRMVDAIRTPGHVMDTLIQGDLAKTGENIKDFEGDAAKKFGDWATGMEQANPFSLGNHDFQAAAIKAGSNLAKQYYHENSAMGVDSAVQRAYDDFVGDSVHVKATGAPGTFWGMKLDGFANIPKNLIQPNGTKTPISDRMADNAVHYMSQQMTYDSLKRINPAVPAGADESQKANFAAYIAAHSPRTTFFTHNGEPVMGITYQGPKVREPVMIDSHTPYTVPFSNASQEQPNVKPIQQFNPDQFGGARRNPSSLPTDQNFEKSWNENLFHQYSSKPDKSETIRKVVGHLTGEAPLSPEEASQLMYPPSEREKLQQTYEPAKKNRTNDEKFMDMMQRRKTENIG